MRKAPYIILIFLGFVTACSISSALARNIDMPELTGGQESAANKAAAKQDAQIALLRPKVAYEASSLRDPFGQLIAQKNAAVAQQARPLPALTVTGIIWGGAFPQAFINNRVVKFGDEIDGVKILEITKDFINVSFSGNMYKLNPPPITQDSPKTQGGRQ